MKSQIRSCKIAWAKFGTTYW